MSRTGVAMLCATAVTLAATACAPREDPRATSIRNRLHHDAVIPHEQIVEVFQVVASAIAKRTMTATKAGIPIALEDNDRQEVLGMMIDPAGVYDAGLKRENGRTLRGFNAPATPTMSEIDASKTMWIDVETLRPARYDFEYSAPGFGDYSYELTFR